MAPFWRENQLVWTKKKELKGELMIWRMKVKARVQHASNQFASK
jgi:hypothetical protein